MKFKSQIVTQASGSVGGTTYGTGRSGMFMRARSIPTNPSTSRQQVVRNAMSSLISAWGSLTEAQRTAWGVYATNVPWKNTLGDSIKLTGSQMFVSCNTPRVQAASEGSEDVTGPVLDAPTVFNAPSLAGASVTQGAATPWTVQLNWNATDMDTGTVLIYVSTVKPQTVNFFKGPYQYQGTAGTALELFALTPNPTWAAGQKIFIRATVTYSDGRLAPAWLGSIVLTHAPVVTEGLLAKAAPRKAVKKAE